MKLSETASGPVCQHHPAAAVHGVHAVYSAKNLGTALAEHLRVELESPTRMSFRKVRTGRKFDSQTTE
jgi:hypothetical protein